jgi:hypothetical protein
MSDTTTATGKIETGNLRSYFHKALGEICDRRNLETSDSSLAYIVNLLCEYSRSDQFFDYDRTAGYDIRPLALLYGDALEAPDQKQRMSALRRLGDVALFISGLFSTSLSRKPAGVDYYIDMGCGAYGWLSNDLENCGNAILNSEVFRELSEWFPQFVSVLDEFADNSGLRGNRDLISLYELWLHNKDPRLAEKIRQQGINVSSVSNRFTH